MNSRGYAALSAKSDLTSFEFQRRALGEHDVALISHTPESATAISIKLLKSGVQRYFLWFQVMRLQVS